MWMCMPENHPLRSELTEKVYRACGMSPDGTLLPGLDDKERAIRMKYAKELLINTQSSIGLDDRKIFPGFNYHPGYPKEAQRVTMLDMNVVEKVASKVVRGIEYIQQGAKRYVEEPYRLKVFFPRNPNDPALQVIRQKCKIFSDGTNTIQRGADPSTPEQPIYIIRLWNQWEIWGVIRSEKGWKEIPEH